MMYSNTCIARSWSLFANPTCTIEPSIEMIKIIRTLIEIPPALSVSASLLCEQSKKPVFHAPEFATIQPDQIWKKIRAKIASCTQNHEFLRNENI